MSNIRAGRGAKLTVSGEKGDGSTLGASTTSSANSVDIILRVVGVVIVQDVSNVSHILSEHVWLAIASDQGIATFQHERYGERHG